MTEYCTRIPADHVPDPYYGGAEGFEYVLDVLKTLALVCLLL